MSDYQEGDTVVANGRHDGLHFILMLTEMDVTIPDALEVYSRLQGIGLPDIAFKDVGAHHEQLAELTDAIHADGRRALLEIADMSEEGQRAGFQLAVDLGVDRVVGAWIPEMAGIFRDSSAPEYWPFVGTLAGNPLELQSSPVELRDHAMQVSSVPGVAGIVAMPYRQQAHDPYELLDIVCSSSTVPLLVAGGISRPSQIESLSNAGAWGFTMGGAILRNRSHDPGVVERRVHEALHIVQTLGSHSPTRREKEAK